MATQKSGSAAKKTSSARSSASSGRSRSRSSSRPKATATLRGRFTPGTLVRLYKASGPEQLRPSFADADCVAEEKVDKHGTVRFSSGVEVGARYFISGHVAGVPLDIRVTGKRPGDEAGSPGQPPVQPDEVKTYGQPRAFGYRGQPLQDPPPHRPVEE